MKLEEMSVRIQEIVEKKNDSEAAHAAEDKLYLDLLNYIASGKCPSIFHAQKLAKQAISTQQLNFNRWTA